MSKQDPKSEKSGRGQDEASEGAFQSPLYSEDVERAVLGAMLVSGEAFDEVSGGGKNTRPLSDEAFYSPVHREVYRAILSVGRDGGKPDRLTLVDELRRTGKLEAVGGKGFVNSLLEDMPGPANAGNHTAIVQRDAERRGLHDLCLRMRDAIARGDRSPEELQAEIYFHLDGFAERVETGGPSPLSNSVPAVMESIERAYHGDEVTGVPTGLRDLDGLLCGLKPATLNLVAARPGDGKTALALNIMWDFTQPPPPDDDAAEQTDVALIFSLEMDDAQLIKRLVCMRAGVPNDRLDNGKLTDEEWAEVTNALQEIEDREWTLCSDDSEGLTVSEIRSRARRMAKRLQAQGKRLSLVVVDYIQLIEPDVRSENRNQELTVISRRLKAMAGNLGVPVLALSQLSRAVMSRHDKRPDLHDLRDSGSLEQDAYSVTMIYHNDDEHSDYKGTAELIVRKHRNGKTGIARAAWLPERQRFLDLARSDQVQQSGDASGDTMRDRAQNLQREWDQNQTP